MAAKRRVIAVYLLAVALLVMLLALDLAALQQGNVRLRLRVIRLSEEIRRRTYLIDVSNADTGAPLTGATILVYTQAYGSDTPELLLVAAETETGGSYMVNVPFSHDGSWYVHIGMNRPIATHAEFSEQIVGTQPGPSIPVLQLEGEPAGVVTLRTFADGYAFLVHLAATACLGLALVLLFVANRARPQLNTERAGMHLFWACIVVLLGTGIYNFVYHTIAPGQVPLSLDIAATWRQFELSSFGNIYAAVLAAKHVLVALLIAVGAVITFAWRSASLSRVRLAAGFALAVGSLILLLGGTLVYLHAISGH